MISSLYLTGLFTDASKNSNNDNDAKNMEHSKCAVCNNSSTMEKFFTTGPNLKAKLAGLD